jgi:hypothetical protein
MDQDKKIEVLLKLGTVVLVSYGAYRLIKSIGSYKAGQVINAKELHKVSGELNEVRFIYSTPKHYPLSFCSKCGKETEQCQYQFHLDSNRCIICNGGSGYTNECTECYHDQN